MSLSLRFPHQNSVRTPHLPIRATCPAGLILRFISRLIFEAYEACRSSIYNFPQSTVTLSLRGPHISVSTILAHPLPMSLPHIKYKILYMSYGRLGAKCQKSQDWTSRDVYSALCTRSGTADTLRTISHGMLPSVASSDESRPAAYYSCVFLLVTDLSYSKSLYGPINSCHVNQSVYGRLTVIIRLFHG